MHPHRRERALDADAAVAGLGAQRAAGIAEIDRPVARRHLQLARETPAAYRAVARAEIDTAGQPLDVERAVARSGLQIGLRRNVDDEARAAPAERPVEGMLGLLARRQADAVAVL